MSVSPVVDVSELIDKQKIGWVQYWVMGLSALSVFADGYDAQAIGYVAPTINKAWTLPPGTLGPVFSASLVGLMIGALLFSPVADRIGRKTMIIISTVVFALGSMLTAALADSVTSLMVLRFLTGLGLGGAMPNAIALTSEYSPNRKRATMVVIMFSGFSLGAAAGGGIAAQLIPLLGWQSVFWLGGIFPLLMVPLFWFLLPESLQFLALKGTAEKQVRAILRRLAPGRDFPVGTRFTAHNEKEAKFPVRDLFLQGRSLTTVLLWVMFFMNLLDLYFMSNWLPTIINNKGLSVTTAVQIAAQFQLGGTFGTIILGWMVDRFGPQRVLSVTFVVNLLLITWLGSVGGGPWVLAGLVFATGFFVVGGQGGLNATAAKFYPSFIRSTGIGWCLGIGRVGSIVGPMIGGLLLAMHLDTPTIFLAGAFPQLLAAASIFILAWKAPLAGEQAKAGAMAAPALAEE
jgi:MFS transporter, AAHS family, 4-hydroxybenzoate transporter